MKTCLRAVLEDGQPGRLLDLSFVGDDHEFGLSADGSEIHIPGRGEFTVTRGTPDQEAPPKPAAVNGIPFSEAIVTDDGRVCSSPDPGDVNSAPFRRAVSETLFRDALWRFPPPLADDCEHDLRLLPIAEPRQTVMCGKCRGLAVEVSAEMGANPAAFIVHEDGRLSRRLEIRKRDPAEAAKLIRAGYADAGIPPEIAEAMIEETLKP